MMRTKVVIAALAFAVLVVATRSCAAPSFGVRFTSNKIVKATGTYTIGDGSLTDTGSLVTSATPLDMGAHLINNVTDPASAQDAATRAYVDAHAGASFMFATNLGVYAPTGGAITLDNVNVGALGKTNILAIDPTSVSGGVITGISDNGSAPTDGTVILLYLMKSDGSVPDSNLRIGHDEISTAANRFFTPSAADITIGGEVDFWRKFGGMIIRYFGAPTNRWRFIGGV